MNLNLYCDNYRTCNSYTMTLNTTEETEARARARGWHIFHGYDQGGKQHDAVLCHHCASKRALSQPPPLQPGQQELFAITAIVDQEAP